MKDFIAIDFETANPKRVSVCQLGYAKVSDGRIVESKSFLVKPVGGHAPFQSKIHGIKSQHTDDKPDFGQLFPQVKDIFGYPLVAHSCFEKSVLKALSNQFGLELPNDYIDTCKVARTCLPDLKNHKLKTLVKYFGLPSFKHHDAEEDACACANIYLKLAGTEAERGSSVEETEAHELKGMIQGILADDVVNYKEVYELIYWLEDHPDSAKQCGPMCSKLEEVMEDDHLDDMEAEEVAGLLKQHLGNF